MTIPMNIYRKDYFNASKHKLCKYFIKIESNHNGSLCWGLTNTTKG